MLFHIMYLHMTVKRWWSKKSNANKIIDRNQNMIKKAIVSVKNKY